MSCPDSAPLRMGLNDLIRLHFTFDPLNSALKVLMEVVDRVHRFLYTTTVDRRQFLKSKLIIDGYLCINSISMTFERCRTGR